VFVCRHTEYCGHFIMMVAYDARKELVLYLDPAREAGATHKVMRCDALMISTYHCSASDSSGGSS
jgi:hypothetical protein